MTMNGENVPEAWDQDMDLKLGALNVNARPFVPNIGAAEFVPSFKKPATNPVPPEAAATASPQNVSPEVPRQGDASEGAVGGKESSCEESTQLVENTVSDPSELSSLNQNDDELAQTTENVPKEDIVRQEEEEEEEPSEDMQFVEKTVFVSSSEKKKDHLNVVFIGHVDAGKSTIGGQIMYLTGMVDKRTLEKYEREAKEKNRETWYLSWVVDTNQEERDKGKTVEVGRAYFETESKHFTILDAPGHRSFVPNMIGGTSQADIAVLVISARKGEFETGFERGGQTREHAMLAKTAGVKHLVVLINKMDDPTVSWSLERFEECKEKLTPFLKKVGFNPKKDIHFMPCSGLTGANLLHADDNHKDWYDGLPLIPYLNSLPTMERSGEGPIRVPIVDKYKDMGTLVLGKLESGTLEKGMHVIMQPNKRKVKILSILSDDVETDEANAGENVKLRLDNIEEDEVSKGFVLCSVDNLCSTGCLFDAQIVIIEYKSIICAGYSAIMHIHTCIEEVEIRQLLCLVDRRTGDRQRGRPKYVKQDQIVIARLQTSGAICIESFKNFPQMGRFTLRDEGKTIAIGKVLKVLE